MTLEPNIAQQWNNVDTIMTQYHILENISIMAEMSAFGYKKSTQSTPHSWYAITETPYICLNMRALRAKNWMKQTENHHTGHHNLRIFLVLSPVQLVLQANRKDQNMSGRSCYKGS